MKTPQRLLCALLPAALSACHVGPRIGELAAPRQPGGARVVIAVDADRRHGPRHEGELVAVSADGVIVALPAASAKPRLTFVSWEGIYGLTATELPGWFTRTENRPTGPRAESLEEWRLVSRYPQGLSAELTASLLAAYGQQSFDSLTIEPQ